MYTSEELKKEAEQQGTDQQTQADLEAQVSELNRQLEAGEITQGRFVFSTTWLRGQL